MPDTSRPSSSTTSAPPHREPQSGADLTEGPLLAALPDAGLLRIEGTDWRRFLQGQLTCNIDEASAVQALAGAYCTPKGRMVANFILFSAADDRCAWLRLPSEQLEAMAAVLARYAVFSKVTIAVEDCLYGLGVVIDEHVSAEKRTAGERLPLPLDNTGSRLTCWHISETGGSAATATTIIQLDDSGHRFELWASAEQLPRLRQQLDHLPTAGPDQWRLLDIRAGLGQVRAATRETFLPQMLNLDLLGAVSFRKGCYTGQEVVARLHYRGKSKRRMHRIQGSLVAGAAPPLPGTQIHNAGNQPQGELVDAVATGPTCFEALAVLAENQLQDTLHMADSGAQIRLLSLPYAITSGSESQ